MKDYEKNAIDHAQKILRGIKRYDLAALIGERSQMTDRSSERGARVDLMKIAEIHADAAYLFHRVQQGTLLPDDAAAAVRGKIDAAIAKENGDD